MMLRLLATLTVLGRYDFALQGHALRYGIQIGTHLSEWLEEPKGEALEWRKFVVSQIGVVGGRVAVKMLCKACKSERLQKLDGELTASLPDLDRANVPPVYVCQDVLVCLDCGFAELYIPPQQLSLLKMKGAGPDS